MLKPDASRPHQICWTFAMAVLLCCLLKRGTLDDLYITFKYARNLADGFGFSIWNLTEAPVEGSTSTVWMVLLAWGIWLGISPYWLSFILASLSFGGIVCLFMLAHQLRPSVWPKAFAGAPQGMFGTATVLLLTYVPLAWYGATGMETTFFALLLAALLLSPVLAGQRHQTLVQSILVVSLILTRPEGLLLGPLLCAYFFWTAEHRQLRHMTPLLSSLLAVALLTAFRLAYFGDVFPNTYYAKAQGDLPHHLYWGARNLSRFLAYTAPAWLIICTGLFLTWRARLLSRFERLLIGLVLFYFAYTLKSGGDPESAFPLWRHFVHIAPIWLLLAACAIERLTARTGNKSWLMVAFIVLTQITLSTKYIRSDLIGRPNYQQQDSDTEFFGYIQKVANRDTVAAAGYAGHWGWLFPGKVIDLWGLNDKHIAHFGTYQHMGELDSRSDMAYVLGRQPDLINLEMDPDDINRGSCPTAVRTSGRSKMLRETLANPGFQESYLFLKNAPYSTFKRALFVHQKFVPQLMRNAPYHPDLVAVSATGILSACNEVAR
jgi:arabinofuranosyltransferase